MSPADNELLGAMEHALGQHQVRDWHGVYLVICSCGWVQDLDGGKTYQRHQAEELAVALGTYFDILNQRREIS